MNPYEVLGILQTDDMSCIKTAYQQSLLKYHPDKCGTKLQTTGQSNVDKFHLIQEAWKMLNDSVLKGDYDRKTKQQSARSGITEVNLSDFQIEQSEVEVEVEEEVINSITKKKEVKVSNELAVVDMYVKHCRCGDRFEIMVDEVASWSWGPSTEDGHQQQTDDSNVLQCNSCSLSICITRTNAGSHSDAIPLSCSQPLSSQHSPSTTVMTDEATNQYSNQQCDRQENSSNSNSNSNANSSNTLKLEEDLLDLLSANSPTVTTVTLEQRGLGDAEVTALCHALAHNTHVSELSLVQNEFSTAGLMAIARLLALPDCCISRLNLSHNRLDVAGAAPLAKAITNNKRLTSIQLCNCGSEAGAVLMAFMQRPSPPSLLPGAI